MNRPITPTRRRLALLTVIAITLCCARWNGFTLPLWVAEMYSGRVISHATTDTPVVALSFDDGPDPTYTPRILQILNRYGVKATFFEEGRMIRLHPVLARRVLAEGHALGNHTETHPYLARLSRDGVRSGIGACDEALISLVGIQTYLFRPPRGDGIRRCSARPICAMTISCCGAWPWSIRQLPFRPDGSPCIEPCEARRHHSNA